jgi:uncharacterized membrane protein YgcG
MEQVPGSSGLIKFDKHGRVYIDKLNVRKLDPYVNELSICSSTSQRVSFFGTSPSTRSDLTAQLTAITHTAPTADYAIQDFTDAVTGAWAFKDHEEANTVLAVIANLQTRLAQLETYLKRQGLLG